MAYYCLQTLRTLFGFKQKKRVNNSSIIKSPMVFCLFVEYDFHPIRCRGLEIENTQPFG